MENQKSKNIYGSFLNSFSWSYYATFSTTFRLSSKSARRAIENFVAYFEKKHGGCQIFFASEPFDLKEGFHIHCLIKINNYYLPTDYKAKKAISSVWNLLLCGSSVKSKAHRVHLKKFNKKLGGSWYVSKYITQPNADYDLFSTLPTN
jgi:hypothetical protein